MARSENMAIIIGNLTRDPELRYTPGGHAVASFGVATNRRWTTAEGEMRESVEFHNVVAWNKLAEICSQLLAKGRRVYIKGRLQTRSWEGQDGLKRYRTEIVADDMVVLDQKYKTVTPEAEAYVGTEEAPEAEEAKVAKTPEKTEAKKKATKKEPKEKENVEAKEIPF